MPDINLNTFQKHLETFKSLVQTTGDTKIDGTNTILVVNEMRAANSPHCLLSTLERSVPLMRSDILEVAR